jgi:hypothetical protein
MTVDFVELGRRQVKVGEGGESGEGTYLFASLTCFEYVLLSKLTISSRGDALLSLRLSILPGQNLKLMVSDF